jgi:hypothetical protein
MQQHAERGRQEKEIDDSSCGYVMKTSNTPSFLGAFSFSLPLR